MPICGSYFCHYVQEGQVCASKSSVDQMLLAEMKRFNGRMWREKMKKSVC